MEYFDKWKVFEATGKVEDYMEYVKEKQLHAQNSFLAAISENGRNQGYNGGDNYSSGNGTFHDANK